MYSENLYGTALYAQEGLDEDKQKYFVDLSRHVPPFVTEMKEIKEIFRIEGEELGELKYRLDDLLKQFFISTATWGLERWEQEYGIESDFSLTYEQRREIILAKKRGRGTVTKQMIKNVAEAFSGGEVNVIEDNPNSMFIIKFIGVKGIPSNMQGFLNMLEDIKPAHLTYCIEYTYSVWDNFKGSSWNSLNNTSWDGAKII